jgi:WD40 repeat protein
MPGDEAAPATASPYVGLSFYREAEASRFFGRDADRHIIMGNLRSSRLTLLYAESGVGKSSLLRAGVAARLGDLARGDWSRHGAAVQVPVVFSNWRDHPVRDLIAEIQRAVNDFMPAEASVELPRESLAGAIRSALAGLDAAAPHGELERPPSSLLIILDQFEEYFQNGSPAERERLADDLAECLSPSASSRAPRLPPTDLGANFLISIRQDAYAALGDLLTSRVSNVYGNYISLRYLDRARASEAIVKPIAWHNAQCRPGDRFEIEDGLVEQVLAQVRRDGGDGPTAAELSPRGVPDDVEIVSPYLQLVMTTLWETEVREKSHTLRLATLAALPAREIVSQSLKDALEELDPQAREIAVDALRYLVTPSGTKIALEVGDLAAPAYTGHPPEILVAVLSTLAGEARILQDVGSAPGREMDPTARRFEIYTDVLAQPINEVVNDRETRRAEERAERDRERARAAERQADLERENARRFRRVAIGAGALGALALIALIWALWEQHTALTAKRVAESNQITAGAQNVATSNPELGALLGLRALDLASTPAAEHLLRDVLPQLQEQRTLAIGSPATSAAFSPDGSLVAIGGQGRSASVWSAATGALRFVFPTPQRDPVAAVAFSPDGRWLLVAGSGGYVSVIDPGTGHQLFGWPAARSLKTAEFDPNDPRQAVIAGDGMARVWSLLGNRGQPAGRDLRRADGSPIIDAVYRPYGHEIATIAKVGVDGGVDFWGAAARGHKPSGASLTVPGNPRGIAFSPDGTQIVTSSDDDAARIFDVAPPHAMRATLAGGDGALASGFSSDGISLVVARRDGQAQIWDRAIKPEVVRFVLTGHANEIDAVSFSPDGSRVVTASADGTARLWSAEPVEQIGSPIVEPTRGALRAADFGGGRLVTASDDGMVRLWDGARHRPIGVLPTTGSPPVSGASATFNRDGTLLVTTENSKSAGQYKGRTDLWEGNTRRPINSTRDPGLGYVTGAEPNRDGTRILTVGAAGARIWTPATRSQETFAAGAVLRGANFSPDGSLIATAEDHGVVRIWDANALSMSPYQLGVTGGAGVSNASFSPDGRLLVTSRDDGTTTVWRLSSRTKIASFSEPGGQPVFGATFSPDGKLVLTASKDGFARVWEVATGALLTSFDAGFSIEDAEWSATGAEIVTAGDDGVARVFSTELAFAGQLPRLERVARRRVDRGLTPAEVQQYASTAGG